MVDAGDELRVTWHWRWQRLTGCVRYLRRRDAVKPTHCSSMQSITPSYAWTQ